MCTSSGTTGHTQSNKPKDDQLFPTCTCTHLGDMYPNLAAHMNIIIVISEFIKYSVMQYAIPYYFVVSELACEVEAGDFSVTLYVLL